MGAVAGVLPEPLACFGPLSEMPDVDVSVVSVLPAAFVPFVFESMWLALALYS